MEFPTIMNWTSPFPILGLLGCIFHLIQILKATSVSKQWRTWSDATFYSVTSDLVLHCLPMSHKKDTRLTVNPFTHFLLYQLFSIEVKVYKVLTKLGLLSVWLSMQVHRSHGGNNMFWLVRKLVFYYAVIFLPAHPASFTHNLIILSLGCKVFISVSPRMQRYCRLVLGSYRQVWVKFKDFSRTSKSLSNSFQGLYVNENTDLSVKSLLQKC